jgi:hypothetical protein
MRTNIVLFALLCLLSLCGCGGGEESSSSRTATPVTFGISWAARSRDVNAPASALSAVLLMRGARPDHGDFTFSVDRNDAPGAFVQTVTTPTEAALGTWNTTVTFHSQKGGLGRWQRYRRCRYRRYGRFGAGGCRPDGDCRAGK